MIKAQPVKAAQLLTRSGAARSAVIALRHDDAVPGMGGGDRGIDGENATMARRDLAHDADEKIRVLAVNRSDQRASSARDQPGGILFISIRHDGRGRAEHLDLVHRLRAARVFELEQGRRNECRSVLVNAVEGRSIGAAADDRRLARQAADAVERRRLLATRHQRPHAGVRLPGIADLGALEFFRQRIGDRIGFPRGHEDAADRGAFLSGLHRHLAHDFA